METKKEKIAIFDFCETLVDFQTADAFVHFTKSLYRFRRMRYMNRFHDILQRYGIISIMTKFFPYSSINKKIILWQLKGLTREQLEKSAKLYFENKIQPHIIKPVANLLTSHQQEGYRVVILSGGYDIYLNLFAQYYGICSNNVFSSKIEFANDICTGKMLGRDCLWERKKQILNEYFDKNHIEYSIAYSDSESDLPMLQWADDAVVVRQIDSYQQPWAHKYGFKELVWHR